MKTITKVLRALLGREGAARSSLSFGHGIKGPSVGHRHTQDATAIQYRMPGGIPGDINRMHPASVEAGICDASTPVTAFGQFNTTTNTGTFRPLGAGDTTAPLYVALSARPYPFQPSTGSNYGAATFGGGAPVAGQPMDNMTSGYMTCLLNDITAATVKGQQVYVWIAATSGVHVQGGIEAVSAGGSTIAIPGAYFNGPADANGNVEIALKP